MVTYLCKECKHNNNGWCNKKKMQGLKKINQCDSYINESDDLPEVNEEESFDTSSYEVLGEIRMYYNMQRQILAMVKQRDDFSEDFSSFVRVFCDMGKHLMMKQKIYNVDSIITSGIDEDIVNGYVTIRSYIMSSMNICE